jgi:hypothetical protein
MNKLHDILSFLPQRSVPALLGAGVLLLAGTARDAAVAPKIPRLPRHGDVCERTAFALRAASMAGAREDFFVGLANCLNDTDADLDDCVDGLADELREARALAREQHEARLHVCKLVGHGAYDPDVDPDLFSPNITNRFLPWTRGRTLIYEKKIGDETERITVTVLPDTVEIAGIECIAVRDLVTIDGESEEDTVDWYAQHRDGSVWYIGEIAQNFEDGLLDNVDGSWRTGKDSAKPGIVMLARPQPGIAYRQEFLPNEAEDVAAVIALDQTVCVPAGRFTGCVQTEDWTPIEPGKREHKFYAPGIGLVLEVNPDTGARTELVEIRDR